jgi:HTH-type transcriptional regulator, competence development regulator
MESFRNLIRRLRLKNGLLLREVAAALQIDPSLMSRIESGKKQATRDQAVKLAHVLKIDQHDLLVSYLSDKIVYELKDEALAKEAMSVAEIKMQYHLSRVNNSKGNEEN